MRPLPCLQLEKMCVQKLAIRVILFLKKTHSWSNYFGIVSSYRYCLYIHSYNLVLCHDFLLVRPLYPPLAELLCWNDIHRKGVITNKMLENFSQKWKQEVVFCKIIFSRKRNFNRKINFPHTSGEKRLINQNLSTYVLRFL